MNDRDRDKKLRQQVQDAPKSSMEAELKRELLANLPEELQGYNELVENEWEVNPGYSQAGKGDLVMTDGLGHYAVIEVKHIDTSATGRTAQTRRNNKRKQVKQQAQQYAGEYKKRQPNARSVKAMTYTNENGLTVLDD
jgi:Holliday junction resolvase-like predicted endonuclease